MGITFVYDATLQVGPLNGRIMMLRGGYEDIPVKRHDIHNISSRTRFAIRTAGISSA
jgi:hypothetical protein